MSWSIFRKSGIRFSARKCDKRKDAGAVSVSGQRETALEHFQEKWNPVFRPKCDKHKNAGAVSETAPA
jgi:hypothetical protein